MLNIILPCLAISSLIFSSLVNADNPDALPSMTILGQPPTSTTNRIDQGYTEIKPNTAFNRSYADSLATDVEVSSQATSVQQQSPIIHGFTGYDNVMLIDGIRMNNPVFRGGPNQYWSSIDPYTVSGSNLYFGQSAMLFGSDAFGSAINVVTRKRTDYSKEGFNWNGRTAYRFASAEGSNIGRAEFEGNYDKKLGFLIGTSIKDYGDMRGGEITGIQPHTGYNDQNVDAKINYNITDKSQFTFAYQQYNSYDAWRNHRVIGAKANAVVGAVDGTYEYDIYDQGRKLAYIKFESIEIPWFDEFSTTASFQQTSQFNTFKKANLLPKDKNGRTDQQLDDYTIGYNIRAKNNHTKIGDLTYGIDYYHDFIGANGTRYNKNDVLLGAGAPPVADNSNYDTLGVYLSDDISLISDRVILSLTSRYNYASTNTGIVVNNNNVQLATGLSQNWDSFTSGGRLNIGIDQKNRYKFFIGANQGWRAPTLMDLSGNALSLSGIFQTPAPTIGPEKFVTYETGIGYTDNKINSVVTIFKTNLDNAINKPSASGVSADNNNTGYMQGVAVKNEFSIIEDLKVFGGFSWTEGYMTSYNSQTAVSYKDNISKVNPINGNVGIHYAITSTIFTEASARFVGAQNRLSLSDVTDTTRIPPGGSAGYSLYGIRAGWNLVKELTLTGAIDNLENTDYRVLGSGVNGLGRNFSITGDYRF